MGLLDNLLKSSGKPKITSDNFVSLLTISNTSFDKISQQVEKAIFFNGIMDPNTPLEYQPENVETKENFKTRFIISSGVTGMAIIEFVTNKKFGVYTFDSELNEFKKKILPNILKLRQKVLAYKTPQEFEEDTEPSLVNKPAIEEQFLFSVTQKANDINKLVNKAGEYRNIYYHFHSALGQVLPDKEEIFFDPRTAEIIDKKIIEVIGLVQYYFDNI